MVFFIYSKKENKILMNEFHFFDLDHTLWEMENYAWVIDKNKPEIPLVKISINDLFMIKKGFYRKDNLKINYNGQEFFISKDLMNKIQKKKIIGIDNIGISYIELTSPEYINISKITFLIKNIKHLVGREDIKIIILTARNNRQKHEKVLNLLRLKLQEMDLEIFKIYFVGDEMKIENDEGNAYKKSIVLLEHMVGMKIDKNSFVPLKQDFSNSIYFYDDEIQNINYANDIQSIFDTVYRNTTNEDAKKIIINRIKNMNPTLYTNLVGTNDINKTNKKMINLKLPEIFTSKLQENLHFIKSFRNFIQ